MTADFDSVLLTKPEFSNGNYHELADKFPLVKDEIIAAVNANPEEFYYPAIASLLLYIQQGYTGPQTLKDFDREYIDLLTIDGEDIYPLTIAPKLLYQAALVLIHHRKQLKHPCSLWWTARCALMHQKVLDNHSQTLFDVFLESFQALKQFLPSAENDRELVARYYLEFGLFYHYYGQERNAREMFISAQEASKFTWNLTGALGKRTKFQQFDVSQLVITAKSFSIESDDKNLANPRNLELNDDTLLENIQLKGDTEGVKNSLNVFDQALLLAFCLDVKNSNPQHGLTNEEMFPYVRRVLETPNNWMVYTMALLLRSRLESNRSRTVERSVLQLQALVDQFGSDESTVQERMSHFFSIDIPSKWDMEKELGERFASLGVLRSALEIFQRLEMWENVITCYQLMEETKKLHCLLAEVRNDPALYTKAWELSKGQFPRAMRSLGAIHFRNKQYQECVDCYRKALAINPLFESSWFVLGCSLLNLDELDEATAAFSRVTSINPENAEAWNNLASVFIKQKKLIEAFRCLKEATRLNFDSAKTWDNYLYVCVDLKNITESIRAMERIFSIRIEKDDQKTSALDNQVINISYKILEIVATAIMDDIPDFNGQSSGMHVPLLLNFLSLVSNRYSSSYFYSICSKVYQHQDQFEKALDYAQKAHRALLHDPQILSKPLIFKQLSHITLGLVEAYEVLGPMEVEHRLGGLQQLCKDWKYQAKMAIKATLSISKQIYEGSEDYEVLVAKLREL